MCEHIICDNDMTTKISVITFQSDVVGIETVPNSNVIREEIKEQVPVFCDRQKNHPYNPYAIQVFIKKGQCIGYLLKDEFLAKAMDQGVAVIRSGYIDYVMNSRISVKMDVEFIQNSDVRELAIEQIRKNDKETICNDKENAEQVIVKWTRSALLPSVLKLVSAKKCTNKCSEEKNTQSDFSDITEIVKSQDNICDPTDQCMSEEQMVENTEENLDLQENAYKIYQEDNTEDSIEESVAKIISMQPAEKEFEDSFVCDSKEERALEEKNKTIQRSELSEEDLLYELSKLFPNGEIYEEEYTKKPKNSCFWFIKKHKKMGMTSQLNG